MMMMMMNDNDDNQQNRKENVDFHPQAERLKMDPAKSVLLAWSNA